MVEKKRKLQVKVELEGELLEKFESIWKLYGVKSAAEVFRILITKIHDELQRQKLI